MRTSAEVVPQMIPIKHHETDGKGMSELAVGVLDLMENVQL